MSEVLKLRREQLLKITDDNDTIRKFEKLFKRSIRIIGEMRGFAGSIVPDDFLECDGSAISRTTYSDLFSVIGVIHGAGDGSTTFNIPNVNISALIMYVIRYQ